MDDEDVAVLVAQAALSPEERLEFLERCVAKTPDELRSERPRVSGYLRTLQLAAEDDPLLDLDLARRIGGALIDLLAVADRWSYQERRLLAGAVAYFVSPADADDDAGSASGLIDDAHVVRTVCDVLSRPDIAHRHSI